MRILVTGASGLIGQALQNHLRHHGVETIPLVRHPTDSCPSAICWDPESGKIDRAGLEGLDAVVHLAGENIASGRWTAEKKRRILDSRLHGTTLLCEALTQCRNKPKALISASAIGYYGDRGDAALDESSDPGTGFLAEVCKAWEGATAPARNAGIRVICLRTGMVLSRDGGALPRMLPPFRLGLGGPIGRGRAWMSWIVLEDLLRVLSHCLDTPTLSGPVNAVSPNPVTNLRFTRALGKALHRPALFPVPPILLQIAFGELARELLLPSARVFPHRMEETGFSWNHPEIEEALHCCL